MNSRNYETHVPPLASNTVTIATSSTGQLRPQISSIRPFTTVPMRQVPIRKVVQQHDGGGGASTSSAQFLQIKEEVDDYQGASTSSTGPLISNSFQQYQRGPGGGGATVTSGALVMNNGGGGASLAMDQPAPVNLAAKVAEVFLTAGHAFQKLGDLTLQLHSTTDADESKWSDKEVDNLKNALTRFAHDLDQISNCVQSRTTRIVKNDIKRRHMLAANEDSQQAPKRIQMSGGGGGVSNTGGTYTTVNSVGMMSGHAVPLGQKRLAAGGQTMGKLMAARTMIPTARFTVAPVPSSSGLITASSGGHQSQSPSPGMPQLQSQGGGGGGPSTSGGPSGSSQQQRIISTTSSGVANSQNPTITRVMAPQQMLQQGGGGVKPVNSGPIKRVITPNSVTMSMPTSGALVLETHND